MYGYHGRVLVVDLSERTSSREPLDESELRRFIGGTGLASYLLYTHCPPSADPMGPDNPLIFACSPLVGSRLTTSSKFAVAAKSPLTGLIGDSLSSSFLAVELKRTGVDALVVKGASSHPAILVLEDDDVRFEDASDLMGMSTLDTEKEIRQDLGRRFRVACIGPAGEHGVRYASIANDGGRQAGRTGTGAVMGSKNLKAIAVRGRNPAPVFDAASLNVVGRDLSTRSLGPATEKYRTTGTMANIAVFDRLGTLPTRNFQQSTFDMTDEVSGEAMYSGHFVKNAHCANCTIGCEKILTVGDGSGKSTGRMEYESAFALGPLVGVGDRETIIRASHYCDEMGMDTISAGGTIAWAMECFERGILTLDDTDGLDLRFGNADALLPCLEAIATKSGNLGRLLAEGSKTASETVGQGTEAWAMHVKGLEMPGYEPRSLQTMALALAVSTRGACHNRSSAYEADFSNRVNRMEADVARGRITADGEDFSAVLDSLIWCKFLRKAFDDFWEESANSLSLITGWDVRADELKKAGERINNLKKQFNVREGWTREDDTLPERVLTEPLPDGVGAGVGLCEEDLQMMVSAYYLARGWNPDGTIPSSKLLELEIGDLRISRETAGAIGQ
ncbi:MAG: aldehyde ferredoxin oxidoreductase family protein [Dehalococcoidia bacterium]|nr:aldehyde ferredoxin oxidoreductase family protein [Dehalococcoidia bacterium]